MWQIQCIELPKDRSKPHINAFLADDASLKEDTLLFSEVWCILMLTLRKLSRFGPFNVVPVSFYS
jgi:hypothetical protein